MANIRLHLSLFVGLSALVSAVALVPGCPMPDDVNEPPLDLADATITIVRVEVDATGLVGLAAGFEMDLTTLEVHQKGGWTEYAVEESLHVAAGEIATVLRVVQPDASAKMLRVQGEFRLLVDEEELPITVPSARGIQVHLKEPLTPGAVNHVRIDLAAALEQMKKGWRLHPVLTTEVEVDAKSVSGAVVTPEAGGVLELKDGFRLEVPPGAVPADTVVHVERVATAANPYYLLGPEHMTFSEKVTAHVPGVTPDPVANWDLRELAGQFDPEGRVVVQNDHFSCVACGHKVETMTELGAASFLFEGDACGRKYSIVVADLHDSRTRVFGGVSDQDVDDVEGNVMCQGQEVYEAELLPAIFGPKPGRRKIAAIPGDVYQCFFPCEGGCSCDVGCARERLTIEGVPIREDDDPMKPQYTLGLDKPDHGATVVTTQAPQEAPIDANLLFSTGQRYFAGGESTSEDFLGADDRNTLAFSPNEQYMFFAVSEPLSKEQWINLLTCPRHLPGLAKPVYADTGYRMDEGGTTALYYSTDNLHWTPGGGSQAAPNGTIMGLAIYESECGDPGFVDVPQGEWFYEPVKQLVCQGALEAGNKDKNPLFEPSKVMNRAEYLKLQLEVAFPTERFDVKPVVPPFTDVPLNAWYAPYVAFAKKEKIVEGYPDNTFKPAKELVRAEAAQMTVRIGAHEQAASGYQTLHSYYNSVLNAAVDPEAFMDVTWAKLNCPDVNAHNSKDCWYYHAAYAMRAFRGSMCGKAGAFQPFDLVRRDQAAKITCLVGGYCAPEKCG